MEHQHDAPAKTREDLESYSSTRQTLLADQAPLHPILQLQKSIGNQAVQRLLAHRGTTLQAKLTIGAAHDPYEQEADRVAQRVVNMAIPSTAVAGQASVQRQSPEEGQVAQTKSLASTITPLVQPGPEPEDASQVETQGQRAPSDPQGSFEPGAAFEARLSNSGDGSPLPASTRAFMEQRFGADFSGVRLHTGSEATHLNRAINAQAFTLGQKVYLGEPKDDLESSAGKQLLAHELTHTIQQGASGAVDHVVQQPNRSIIQPQAKPDLEPPKTFTPAPAPGVFLPPPPLPGTPAGVRSEAMGIGQQWGTLLGERDVALDTLQQEWADSRGEIQVGQGR